MSCERYLVISGHEGGGDLGAITKLLPGKPTPALSPPPHSPLSRPVNGASWGFEAPCPSLWAVGRRAAVCIPTRWGGRGNAAGKWVIPGNIFLLVQRQMQLMSKETEMSFWRNFHHQLHRMLWFWVMHPATKISSKGHFRYTVAADWIPACIDDLQYVP